MRKFTKSLFVLLLALFPFSSAFAETGMEAEMDQMEGLAVTSDAGHYAALGNMEAGLLGLELTKNYAVEKGFSNTTQLDDVKAMLKAVIEKLKASGLAVKLAVEIAEAEAMLKADGVTAESITAVLAKLDAVVKPVATEALQNALVLAEILNSDELRPVIALVKELLTQENPSIDNMLDHLTTIITVAKPIAQELLESASLFANAFGYSDLLVPISEVKTALESGDIEQVKDQILMLGISALPKATEALEKVKVYAEAIALASGNTALIDAVKKAQANLAEANIPALLLDLKNLPETFVSAATSFIDMIQSLNIAAEDEKAEALKTALSSAVVAIKAENRNIISIGLAVLNLSSAYDAYKGSMLDQAKAKLKEDLEQLKNSMLAGKLVDVIAEAEAALNAKDASSGSILLAITKLDGAVKTVAKDLLMKAVELAGMLGSDDLNQLIAVAKDLLAQENPNTEELTNNLAAILDAVKPVAMDVLDKVNLFASLFGFTDLQNTVAIVKTIVEIGDIEQMQPQLSTLSAMVLLKANEAMTKVKGYAETMAQVTGNTSFFDVIKETEKDLINMNIVDLLFDIKNLPETFLTVSSAFVQKIQYIKIANTPLGEALKAALDAAVTSLQAETLNILTIGNNMRGLIKAYRNYMGTVGISNLNADTETSVIYDMQGRRILSAQKGLYIINGKKVIVR